MSTELENLEHYKTIADIQKEDDRNYVADCLFETDNMLEIPTLRMDMQAVLADLPFVAFGEQKRTFQMNGCGTLHFYVDDYRYSRIYDHPEQILHHNPRNIVEPNFSLFNETPVAMAFERIYKKRFIARAMQEKGIRVFCDINVATKHYAINMIGVPKGWQAYCTRGYSDRIENLQFEVELARNWASGNPILMVVYGGGEKVKNVCREEGLIYVNPVITIKNKAKAFEQIKDSIAFFGQQLDPLELMPQLKELPTLEDLKKRQVEDYTNGNLIEAK